MPCHQACIRPGGVDSDLRRVIPYTIMRRNYILAACMAVITAAVLSGCSNTAEMQVNTETELLSETGTAAAIDEIKNATEAAADAGTKNETAAVTAELTEETGATPESVIENENQENAGFDVQLGNYTGFTYTRTYTEPDVNAEMESILGYYITYEESGAVAEGDYILLSFTGTVDGEEVEGIAETDSEIVVGEGTYGGDFEEKLVGLPVGETSEIEVSYPDDYWQEDLAGNTAVMTVTVSGRADAPALTDEWVSENTGYESVEAFREYVKSYLVPQAEEEADSAAIYSLLEDLYAVSSARVSEEELAERVEEEAAYYEAYASDLGMDFDDYVEAYYGTDTDSFIEMLEEELEETIAQEKIVDTFIEAEEINVSEEAFADYLNTEAAIYGYDSGEDLYEEMDEMGYGTYIKQLFKEYQAGMALMEISEQIDLEETEEMETEQDTESITVGMSD
ncbi:MAG: FKBP-type peptidyl-prolyl cis-trans isomerase [Clostridiales bacterium]|nr:FKBP-type peptidyl-prolyl cis-trans isomerase [Clostridiales bacterium]